jgi:riboflavin kinase / FMN adenylyltransferase
MAAVQRFEGLAEVPPGYGPSVVVIGNFDGVHRGHQAVLARVVEEARRRDARAVAVTFDPHPQHVLHPATAPPLLTGLDRRADLLSEAGLDAVLVLPFTERTPYWPAEDFVASVVAEALRASAVVAGRDVRFGTCRDGRASDLATLEALGEEHGFDVLVLDDVLDDAHLEGPDGATGADPDRRWSSSWVRELLTAGDVATAAAVLGRPHRVTGTVVHGDHRGRELGYPTANLGPGTDGLVPADGVYAGWMVRPHIAAGEPDQVLPAAVSIGTNPTFDGVGRRVEAYVLDRDDLDLYGERVGLDLVERLRPTERFDGVEALVAQMDKDVARCRDLLG